MIFSFQALSGFMYELPSMKDRSFTFTPGLNVIFGPNGCGKSTMLQTIGAHCMISKKGGIRQPPPYRTQPVAKWIEENTPGKCKAEVKWDGSPACLYRVDSALNAYDQYYGIGDGTASFMDSVRMFMDLNSSGQETLMSLTRLMKKIKDPKTFDLSGARQDTPFMEYIKSLPQNGNTTLLLDEPDRSLSLDFQFSLWTKLIPNIVNVGRLQVIVASHSPFALLAGKVHDMVDGYAEAMKKAMEAFSYTNRDEGFERFKEAEAMSFAFSDSCSKSPEPS